MAIIGRVLEAQGFRVGIIAQPDWRGTRDFQALGEPRLFFGVTGGNMDSMVNRYTSDRRVRSDDAYTPGGEGGKRPDRCVIVYSQRCARPIKDVPIVIGGIEASLRRIAHFDYWSDQVRRSVLVDAQGGPAGLRQRRATGGATSRERLDAGEPIADITDLRGTAYLRRAVPARLDGDRFDRVDTPGPLAPPSDPVRRRGSSAPRRSPPSRSGHSVVKFYRKVPNARASAASSASPRSSR